jgi:hypothetical protein
MRTQINTTQKRNKKKQSIKIDKDPMQSKHNPKKKTKVNKSTRQMRTQVDTTQKRNKNKQSTKIR